MWLETGRSDTRLFIEPIIPNSFVLAGTSKAGSYREHIVPRIILCEECHKKLEQDYSDGALLDMAIFIRKFLKVILITSTEQRTLDHELGLKTRMPDGWTFETGSPFARLDAAKIDYELL